MRSLDPNLAKIVAKQPRTGVPFLNAFRVHHGPPGLLGRFFLSAETRLQDRGITLQFISFDELLRLSQRNADNWGSLNPMFDPRTADITPGSFCLAGYDKSGEIKICISAKPFDASQKSFAAIVNTGGFTSARGDNSDGLSETTIETAFAYELHGMLGYAGAVWVHPSIRGDRLASIFVHILNSCMLTLWNPDCFLGSVPSTTVGTGLFQRYGYPHAMAPLTVTLKNKHPIDLTIVWMTPAEFLDGLTVYLDEIWPKFDAAVAARDRQQSA